MRPLFAPNVLLLLLICPLCAIGGWDVKEAQVGNVNLVEETQLKFPKDYLSDFEEDTQKKAEFGDAYDEEIAPLPGFDLWQNGRKIGTTELPIVTRRNSLWSTSLGTTRQGLWWQTTEKWRSTTPPWEKATEEEGEGDRERKGQQRDKGIGGEQQKDQRSSKVSMETTETTNTAAAAADHPAADTTNGGRKTKMSTSVFSSLTMPRTTEAPHITPSAEPLAWSRSWRVGTDGKMELRIWESGKGERVEVLSREEGQRFIQSQRGRERAFPTLATTQITPETTKPHRKENWQKGITSNCNVLDAAKDGQPSEDNDEFCKLTFPGIPADDQCKCTYEARGRDEKGCAVGFIYTCKRVK